MRVMLLVCVLAAGLCAQTAPKKRTAVRKPAAAKTAPAKAEEEKPPQFAIVSLKVEGEKLYPEAGILALSGLKVGDAGSKEAFDSARDRLLATALFETVGYRYEPGPASRGYAVTFEVAEIGQVYPVRFTRLGMTDEEAMAALKKDLPLFTGSIPATDKILLRARESLDAVLKSKGLTADVSTKVASDNPDDLHVLFYPAGAPPIVAEVHFKGNKILPTPTLQLAIHGVAVGTEYRENFFRQILGNAIIPLYEARGRLRVKFPNITVENAPKVKGISVTVEVEEGESYKLSHVAVTGAAPLNEDLLASTKLKVDDIANFDEVKAAQARIRDSMRMRGYLKVASVVERKLNDEKLTADLTIRVTPGIQYKFGKLTVTGLDLLGTPAVEKRWALEPGKPYNASYPDFFIARIQEERMFEDLGGVHHTLKIDDAKQTVDVTLVFSPMKREEKKEKF